MGCYDSVVVRCPACGGELEFQSKADKCLLRRFSIDSVPPIIAESLNGAVDYCAGCGKLYQITLPNRPPRRVAMRLQDAEYLGVEEDYD